MIAYKGFNADITCTMGHGEFRYEVGGEYREEQAECARTGFHCVEEPIEVLRWYSDEESRYCIVDAGGDIHEDGTNKISCSEIKILKEISLEQLGALECEWIRLHPDRETSKHVLRDQGEAEANGIVVVRGKNPRAAGRKGSTIFLLKEGKGTKEIIDAGAYTIDGETYKEYIFYTVRGRVAKCVRKN